ncbi:hypothetical protein HanRHA438_Chr10g0476561 [Helianthus annuus]|nr:hypothetical protein HanRHA438_Chr10g0476561 [Helianthus annuus]
MPCNVHVFYDIKTCYPTLSLSLSKNWATRLSKSLELRSALARNFYRSKNARLI